LKRKRLKYSVTRTENLSLCGRTLHGLKLNCQHCKKAKLIRDYIINQNGPHLFLSLWTLLLYTCISQWIENGHQRSIKYLTFQLYTCKIRDIIHFSWLNTRRSKALTIKAYFSRSVNAIVHRVKVTCSQNWACATGSFEDDIYLVTEYRLPEKELTLWSGWYYILLVHTQNVCMYIKIANFLLGLQFRDCRFQYEQTKEWESNEQA